MYNIGSPEPFLSADNLSFEPEPLDQSQRRWLFRQNRVGASFDDEAARADGFERAAHSRAALQQYGFERYFMRRGKLTQPIGRGKSGNASAEHSDARDF